MNNYWTVPAVLIALLFVALLAGLALSPHNKPLTPGDTDPLSIYAPQFTLLRKLPPGYKLISDGQTFTWATSTGYQSKFNYLTLENAIQEAWDYYRCEQWQKTHQNVR